MSDISFITVFVVYRTTNEWGGRGGLVGVFSSQGNAELAAKGQGWYGGTGVIVETPTVIISGKCYLLANAEPVDLNGELTKIKNSLRKQGLAKLSKEEKEALGLK